MLIKSHSKSSEESWTSKTEYFIQKFFLIITACPVRINKNPAHLKVEFVKSIRYYSFIIILLIIVYLLTIIILRVFCLHPSSDLGVWNESSNLTFVLSTCLVIFIETQFTFKPFMRFLLIKQDTERDLLMLCSDQKFDNEKYQLVKEYWKLLITFQAFSLILDLWNLFRIRNDILWFFYCCCLMLPTMFTRLRCFQHRFYTSTIHFYVKLVRIKMQQYVLEMEFKERLAKEQGQKEFSINGVRFLKDLYLSKRIFTSAFQMAYLVNKMFGFSLLMNVIENFVQLLCNLFWIYSKLHRQELDHLPGEW